MSTDDLPQPPGPQPGAGAPPAGDAAPGSGIPPRRGGDGFFDSIRRMGVARSDDRWVGGVAGGIAERFGLDPLLVRGLLILSFFLTGAGIVIYAIAWALLPERRDGRIHLQQAIRGDFDVALLGAVVVMVIGFAWGDGLWSWGFGIFSWIGGLLWIAVWVAIIWLVVKLVRDRRGRRAGGPAGPAAGPAAGPQTGPGGAPGQGGGPVPPPAPWTPQDHFTPAPPAPYVATSAAAPADPATTSPVPPAGGAPSTGAAFTGTPAPGIPYAGAAPTAPARPAPPVVTAPVPPRPVRRGPGAGAVGIVFGLVLLAGALLVGADRVDDLGMPLLPAWLGASIVIIGLGIVVTGLRGRRGGVLTFLAILALVAGVATWPFAGDDVWDRWQEDGAPNAAVISDGTLTPTSTEEAENGVVVRLGSASVDLTELDLSEVTPGDPVVVPISMAAGMTRVLIPEGEAVEAEVDVIAGNVTWHADDTTRAINTYTDGPVRFATDEVDEHDGARLLLAVDVRAGDLNIEESR
ncbi:PspC domain-containing protein [Isoptericola cucumis]|uniref:PspC domain-containing protein n=1 Tax=Isoptericola cucumis TaxID=1776856 RepID=UPI003209875F